MHRFSKLLTTGIFVISLLLVNRNVHAQEQTPQPTPTPIHYDLAFPGILPDHPLYKLKVLRDKISLRLIDSPQQRVAFYLLQADKGVLAMAILVDKKNYPLAATTLLKAEHNMTMLVNELYRFDQPPVPELLEKLKIASLKHLEVINVVALRVPDEEKKSFAVVADFSVRNRTSIEDYRFSH